MQFILSVEQPHSAVAGPRSIELTQPAGIREHGNLRDPTFPDRERNRWITAESLPKLVAAARTSVGA